MKILHVIPNLKKGGAERIVLDICNELQQQENIEVQLITFYADNHYEFLTQKIDWKVIRSSVNLRLLKKHEISVEELQKHIDAFQPDVIHTHLFEAEIVLSQIKTNAKRVVHFHNNIPEFEKISWNSFKSKRKLTNLLARRSLLKNLDKNKTDFIAISKNALDYCKNNLPKRYKIHLKYNAIDFERFYRPVKNHSPNVLCMIGSLVDKKNQSLAIEVVHELKKRNWDTKLFLLGDGTNMDLLRKKVESLSLQKNVILKGNVDHPEEYLANSTIYIHTAKYEPFGLVLIEAMAAGLPIVCTNGGGNSDLIKNGYNGYMVNKFSHALLADRIEEILKDNELRTLLGTNAQTYSAKFDIKNYCDDLIHLYQHRT